MENTQPTYEMLSRTSSIPTQSIQSSPAIMTNLIILILSILLILSFLGINLLDVLSNIIKSIIALIGPSVGKILAAFGYSSGTLINKSADVVSDTAKLGIDIAEGTVQDIGNLLISASSGGISPQPISQPISQQPISNTQTQLDVKLTTEPRITKPKEPSADSTENPIQKPISASKTGWCLIGEYENRRGCIAVGEQDKCLSGQIFPSQKLCLNPNITSNVNK
jgi:hypothetical protein